MPPEELAEMIRFELDAMHLVVDELQALLEDVNPPSVSVRDKAAAGAFLAQFYMGVENILKRIVRYLNLPLPTGANWHLTLFELFCEPTFSALPVLFSEEEAEIMGPYRRFRHLVHHGYGFHLEWILMAKGIEELPVVLEAFETRVNSYLDTL